MLVLTNNDVIKEEIRILKHNISKLQRVIQDDEIKLERKTEIDSEITKISSAYEEVPDIDTVRDDLEYLRNYHSSQIEM